MQMNDKSLDLCFFRANAQRTGSDSTLSPGSFRKIKWQVNLRTTGVADPLACGKTIFVGTAEGLCALDSTTGKSKWRFHTGERVFVAPVVFGGNIFFTSAAHLVSGHLYALDARLGREQWKMEVQGGTASSPIIWKDTLYLGDSRSIYAIDVRSRRQKWVYVKTSGLMINSPTVWNNIIYVSQFEGDLLALDAHSGKLRWHFPAKTTSLSCIVVYKNLIFYAAGQSLYVLNPITGSEQWKIPLASGRSSPAIWNDTLYIGSHDHSLYAIDIHRKTVKWRYKRGES